MLLRSDPFRTFDALTRELLAPFTGNGAGWMPMDAVRRDGQVEVTFDLPGIDPSTVEVTVDRNVLTVKAERHARHGEGAEVIVRERPEGTFTRRLLLSDVIDRDKVSATYSDGVLTLTLPLAEAAKPRRIEVTSSPKAVTGTSQPAAERQVAA